MESLIPFGILSLIIVLAPSISAIIKIPVTVVEIVLGAVAFHVGIIEHTDAFKTTAKIGFLFLMFLAGMEVDLKSFLHLGKAVLKKVMLYFFILYSLAICLVVAFNLSPIYIAAFPIMSLGMIMTLVHEYGKEEPWLDIALKIGIIGELISIGALVLLNGYFSFGIGWNLLKTFSTLMIFLISIALCFKFLKILFWWFPKIKLFIIPKNSNMNQDVRVSIMLFFTLSVIVIYLGLDVVLGSFLAGMLLATFFSHEKKLHKKLSDFGFGFLIPLFFIYVGSTLDLNLLFSEGIFPSNGNSFSVENFLKEGSILLNAILIVTIMVTFRLIAAFLSYKNYFSNNKNLILFALSDSMPLTFLVATATLGLQFQAISENEYYSFVIAAILGGVIFTTVIKIIFNYKPKIKK